MWKRVVLAVLAVFVAWSVIDLIVHNLILCGAYEATSQLWRPMEEMCWSGMYVVGLIAAACFVLIYWLLISPKSLNVGLVYGLIFGVGAGASMGFGSYTVMPLTFGMASGWFLGTLVDAVVGGALVALIVKETAQEPAAEEESPEST